jgi:hypothetical protein
MDNLPETAENVNQKIRKDSDKKNLRASSQAAASGCQTFGVGIPAPTAALQEPGISRNPSAFVGYPQGRSIVSARLILG